MSKPLDKNTPVQRAYFGFQKDAQPVYDDLIEELAKQLEGDLSVAKAVDSSFEAVGYGQRIENAHGDAVLSSAIAGTEGTGITLKRKETREYFLNRNFYGASLSDRVYNGDAQKLVKEVLNNYTQARTSVQSIFKGLQDGGIKPNAQLPKKLTDAVYRFRKAGADDPALRKEIKRARKYVESLSGREISSEQQKKAYNRVLDALEKGDAKRLDKALDHAVNKKVGYLNKQVSRTETMRANAMSARRAYFENPDIKWVQFVLSSGHKIPDFCEVHTDSDLYGKGPGVVPVKYAPDRPFHTNCMCGEVPIIATEGEALGRYNQECTMAYLEGLTEERREDILGVGVASGPKKGWVPALEKKGFVGKVNTTPMVPKSLVE